MLIDVVFIACDSDKLLEPMESFDNNGSLLFGENGSARR
jgi:hypothetical protein